MDKKIILSVLIVALIGIVAATYQINTGQNVLNPLSSVDTDDAPLTDVLAAPESQSDANTGSQSQAQSQDQSQQTNNNQQNGQQNTDNNQQTDNTANNQQNTANNQQNDANTGSQSQDQSQQTTAGTTQRSTDTISSGDTIVVPGSSNSGSSQNTGNNNNSDNNNNGNTGDNNNTGNTGDNNNTGNNNGNNNNRNTGDNNQQTDNTNQITEQIKTSIQSIIKNKIDSDKLTLDMDNCQLEGKYYKVPAYYKDTTELAGTFYVDVNSNTWHFIDKDGNYHTEETPTPGAEGNGQLVTDNQ